MPVSIRIAFVGDSFVNGYGDPEHLGWAGRLCARARARGHDVTGYNLGVRRWTSADVRRTWEAEVRARLVEGEARLIVFSFGVNDCAVEDGRPRVAPAESAANADAILVGAEALARVLFVGPPPVGDDAANFDIGIRNRALGEICARRAVPFFDAFQAMGRSAAWRAEVASGDGAHPGAGGYNDLAIAIDAWPPWRAILP